jgi:hypothetical protein
VRWRDDEQSRGGSDEIGGNGVDESELLVSYFFHILHDETINQFGCVSWFVTSGRVILKDDL